MKRFKFLLPVALLAFVACNSQNEEKEVNHENHQKAEMKDEQKDNKDEHEETVSKVQLDNGKKWKANAETITGINLMSSLVQNGIDGKMDAAKLVDSLQVEFKTIFDKCTMTGESHNQLHNFLIPIKGQLEKLKAGNTDAEILKEMQEYLLTFKNYFE
jgi:hypothetical protein